ncbi:hypothetical protein BC834DRAFT_1034064 [Gloeopeniophorella convolvens]|nr:hypothetical protein BC834DRAFT_1034064 [Gloeopeniophorella convolvens]
MSEAEIPPVNPAEDLSEWLDNHHQLVDAEDAEQGAEQVHVFAEAGAPVFGLPPFRWWRFNVFWMFWCFFWNLQGVINLVTLDINGYLSIFIPFITIHRLVPVRGNLKDGVRVSFNIGIVKGVANFFVRTIPGGRWLYVQLWVFQLFRRPIGITGRPVTRTVRLIPIPSPFKPQILAPGE